MDKTLYRAAKPIFDEACELPESEQLAFVAKACAGNVELRSLVEELLQAQNEPSDDNRALNRAIERSIAPSDEQPGAVIDRFELCERIGEGGFGTVWRANQKQPVQRDVALKVLKQGMDSRKIVARFEAERQALALMDHPNIAQVFDGGVTQSGRPYFAMELVDGSPVTDYCRDKQLNLKQRLDLFVKVCNAIQHAHQKGIIHRDIKPSNVLITELAGEAFPKVIDFGIAKAIASYANQETQLTEQHQIIGTPEYMAPEQLDRQHHGVDTRADVYALGVLLYELLTGSRPFENGSSSEGGLHSLLDAIRASEPQKPSTRAATHPNATRTTGNPTRTHVALRGDLDWIVLRALEKDRARRYESVGALADDIRRHLRHEPVTAGPPSRIYRMRKFVARNRGSVLAGALVMMSLVAGLIGSSVALGWALEERERANERFDLALDAVRDYHSGVAHDVILRQQNMAPLRARLLEPPRKLYEKLEQSLSADARPEERTALCEALTGLASLLTDVGQGQQAIATYQRAIVLLEQLEREATSPTPIMFERATLLGFIGRLLAMDGQTDAAIESLQQAIGVVERVVEAGPSTPAHENQLADVTAELGSVYRQRGDLKNAEEHWQSALTIYQRLRSDETQRTNVSKDIADVYNSRGRVALNSAQATEARELFSAGLAITEELLARHPDMADEMTRVATCSGNLGNACSKDSDEPAAKLAYERAIELGKRLIESFPGNSSYRYDLGNHHSAYAATLAKLGDDTGANENYDRALELLNTAHSVADRRLLAQAFTNSGGFLLDHDHEEAAVERFRNAVAVFDTLLKDSPDPDIWSSAASCFNNYAGLAKHRGQLTEAQRLYERSIEVREHVLKAYPDSRPQQLNMSTALCNLGKMLYTAERYQEAIPYFTRSIAITSSLAAHFQGATESRWWHLHRSGYWNRANAYQMSDQYKLSVSDWLDAAIIDNGKMRAPYLTQLFGDMIRGDLFANPAASVKDIAKRSGATMQDLSKVCAAYLRDEGNQRFLIASIAIADYAAPIMEREAPTERWRFYDMRAAAELQSGDEEAAFASQTRALNALPANAAPQLRKRLQASLAKIDAARGR